MVTPAAMTTPRSKATMATRAVSFEASTAQRGVGSASWICAIPESRSRHTSSPAKRVRTTRMKVAKEPATTVSTWRVTG
jgi:hypothetical protein